MNKTKKLLSVLLAVIMALSCMSVMASAAKTNYRTVEELTALDAYSPYGQVTRLDLEERTSIVLDFLDNVLAKANINLGKILNINLLITTLDLTIDLRSVDALCLTLDDAKDLLGSTLVGLAMGIVDLGILESLNLDSWATGMSRSASKQFTIVSEVVELLSTNTTLVGKVFTEGLNLGLVSLGDMSAIEDIIMNLPGMLKGLIYPMIERWDDTVADVKMYDDSIAGKDGSKNVEYIANWRVKKLFSDNMSITTIKYDANGNMTSEHELQWLAKATGTADPTASDSSLRYYYKLPATVTVGSRMHSYHIVDAAEAEALAKDADKDNDVAAYNYIKEDQVYVLEQEVEGSETYVWKAYKLAEDGETIEKDSDGKDVYLGTLKYYNDDSQLLRDENFNGNSFDLVTMSAADLLYTFVPVLFDDLAVVVLNGSVKKILAEFFGAKFNKVGLVGDDAVNALQDSSNEFFSREQGDYAFGWSDYLVVKDAENGDRHYWRYEDEIWVGDISNTNNYFEIIDWEYEITGDFMDEFVPENGGTVEDRLLLNLNDFLVKVAETIALPSAETVDKITGFEATWTRPTFAEGNANLVANIKAAAQAVIGLAPQHIFGSDYATNERCYVELMLDSDNDVVLTGLAAQLVDILMPSMSLPGKSDIKDSGAKVGAVLAAVIREFAAYLAPEYDFDALIYTDFGKDDGKKNFVTGKDSGYWFDVCLTMGINVGFEYLRAFADMGEGTTEWTNFVTNSGYKVDGGTYTEADLKLDQAVNHWEAMLDYVVDWALATDKEWCWKMGNIVNYTGTVNLGENNDPWQKIDSVLFSIIPFDEILKIEPAEGQTKLEHFLREDLILGIVDLKWDHLINTIQFSEAKVDTNGNVFRQDNVLDQLAKLLKKIVNGIFVKGNENNDFALIPAAITDFDTLATQANIVTLVKELVGVLYNAFVTDGFADTIFPFLGFLFGWKTDPQKIADPQIWTDFRNGNDYAYLYDNNLANQVQPGGAINGDGLNFTKIKILNNSAGMLETHRNSTVTDHAYDIQLVDVVSDATTNTLTFTAEDKDVSKKTNTDYGTTADPYVIISPWETLDVVIGGTYNGEESTTVTIAYNYVGKDGNPIGGTQYTSLTFLVSNQYEDANIMTRWSGDDDDDYTATSEYNKFIFTEDIYKSVTEYEQSIYFVKPSIDLTGTSSKSFTQICANGEQRDCNGNITNAGDVPQAPASDYFEFQTDKTAAGWEDKIDENNGATGKLYKAKDGVTADTEFPYGDYDMGNIAVQYGGTIVYEVNFIYYNSYGLYDIYTENKDNGYNANQGVAADIYNEYNEAWKTIVYGATYPMMTEMNGTAEDKCYVNCIQPYIPAAIERFEAAKEAYETALADAQASGAGTSLPQYITALREEIDDDFANGKEINFQDYEFYEYFNYSDVKTAAENLYRTYLEPEVLDTYHIFRSGIREAELNFVIDAEANATKAEAIRASRLVHDADAIEASKAARDEWKAPITTKLVADDFTSRLAYYKQFLNTDNREANDHLKFLEREIAFVEAQGLLEADYEGNSWAKYADALAEAKAVAAGEDEFSSFNSRIYDVKYNLMVAYKQLLHNYDKDSYPNGSLIQAGGTAELLANIEKAEAILAMNLDEIELSEAGLALKDDDAAEMGEFARTAKQKALGHLIEALGYNYQARYSKHDIEVQDGEKTAGELKYNDDGTPMMFNLYDESAYEYAQNDRPNKTSNQAKVDACNANLEACLAYFVTEVAAPELGAVEGSTGVIGETTVVDGIKEGYIYGVTAGTEADKYFELVDASTGTVEWTASTLSAAGTVNGTGAVATVKDTNKNVVAVYTLVIFGDVNGDGGVTGEDEMAVQAYNLGATSSLVDVAVVAGDVTGDSNITGEDEMAVQAYNLGATSQISVNPYVS